MTTNNLNTLLHEDKKLNGSRLRNREFMLSIFEEALKHKAFILERTKEVALDANRHLVSPDKITEDIALRAHIMMILDDLMRGAESVYQSMFKPGSFEIVHAMVKNGYEAFQREGERDGITPA